MLYDAIVIHGIQHKNSSARTTETKAAAVTKNNKGLNHGLSSILPAMLGRMSWGPVVCPSARLYCHQRPSN